MSDENAEIGSTESASPAIEGKEKNAKGQTVLSMTEVNELDTSLNPDTQQPNEPAEATDFDRTIILSDDDATVLTGATSLDADLDATELQSPQTQETDFDATIALSDDDATILAGGTEALSAPSSKPTFTPRVGIGSTINDRFTLEKLLGRGGMGEVYLATDKRKLEAQDKNPYVAMKVLGENFKQHPQAFIALQREARKTQELAHPNIVTVYDFDRQGESVYLTMEALSGKPMDEEIRSEARSIDEAVSMITQCSKGLAYAHEKDLVHSDLKPGNVFITDDNLVKLLDFGIARAFKSGKDLDGQESSNNDTIFDAGDLGALTPAYASLEMINGEEPHLADDVYALGLIAYELLTGKHPFNKTMATKALEEGLKPERIKGLNKQQWQAIEGALAFKREDRIQSAGDFLSAFTAKSKTPLYIAASVILAAFIAVGSLNFFITPELGPDIPFAELPVAQQQAINTKLNEYETALKFNDLNGAVQYLNQAYDLHPLNKQVMENADELSQKLAEKIQALPKTQQSKMLETLLNYPAFSNNKHLITLRQP